MRLLVGAQALQVIRHASSLLANARDFSRDVVELVKLEATLAMESLVSIALLSIVAALFLFTAWILLILSLVTWLAEDWLSMHVSLLVVGLVIIAGALPILFMIKGRAGNLAFKATRRQLGGGS
jgi:ABC-type multidrug transport system fused ATPase/permease subunit